MKDFYRLATEGIEEVDPKVRDRINFLTGLHFSNEHRISGEIMGKMTEISKIQYSLMENNLTPEERASKENEVSRLYREADILQERWEKNHEGFEAYKDDSKLIAVNGNMKYAEGRILVVEDDVANREILTYCIANGNFLVDTAENGSEGLEKAVMNNYPVIVSDFTMPGMNGLEMGREIRERVRRGEMLDPKIIYLTGQSVDDLVSVVKPYAFIKKPFDTGKFLSTVSRAYDEVMATPTE